VKTRHPFVIHGWVVLPEHLHCLIQLTSDDADYATRLRLIKVGFSKSLPFPERRSAVRVRRGELRRDVLNKKLIRVGITREQVYLAVDQMSTIMPANIKKPYAIPLCRWVF
jgi:REP element-mobilizing transposase RayT